MTFDGNDFDMLGEYVILLTKRRGALKLAVTKMVQKACECLEKAGQRSTISPTDSPQLPASLSSPREWCQIGRSIEGHE